MLATLVRSQTFTVSPTDPAANFASLSAAVAAVPDGSTLLVGPGSYGAFSIVGKGLTVVGGPGVILSDAGFASPLWFTPYSIENTAANQPVVLHGFDWSAFDATLLVRNCAGSVLLSDLEVTATFGSQAPSETLHIENCPQAMIRNCVLWTATILNSDIVIENSNFDGFAAWGAHFACFGSSRTALTIVSSTATLAGCMVLGGRGAPSIALSCPNHPAIQLNGQLRLLGGTTLVGASTGGFNLTLAESIAGLGNVRIDPGVTLMGPVSPNVTQTPIDMPTVTGTDGTLGGTLVAQTSSPGMPSILLVGLPGPPTTLPGIADPFWILPEVFEFAAIGTTPVSAVVNVPNQPLLRGALLAWHCVAVTPTGLLASNPTLTLIK